MRNPIRGTPRVSSARAWPGCRAATSPRSRRRTRSVRPISSGRQRCRSVAAQPRWTPPIPPVAMKWMPGDRADGQRARDGRRAARPGDRAGGQVAARRPCARRASWASRSMRRVVEADAHGAVDDRDGRRHGARVARTRCWALAGHVRADLRRQAVGHTEDSSATTGSGADQRPLDFGVMPGAPRGATGHQAPPARDPATRCAMLHSRPCPALTQDYPRRSTCANHPKVETGVSAAPIAASRSAPTAWCPRRWGSSAASAPAMPRSARVTLHADKAVRAAGAAFGVGHGDGGLARLRRRVRPRVLHVHPGVLRRAAAGRATSGRPAITAAGRRPGSRPAEPAGRTSSPGS